MKKWTLALLLTSCAGARPPWSAPEEIQSWAGPPAPGFGATYLLCETRYVLEGTLLSNEPSTTIYHHNVLQIHDESGYPHGDVRVSYSAKGKILEMSARVVTPDGEVTEVSPDKIYEEKIQLGKNEGKVRVFAFPRVRPGSILEYRYAVKYPFITGSEEHWMDAALPIKKYRLELRGPQDIRWAVRAYNAPPGADWKIDADGGDWRLAFFADNLIPPAEEALDLPERQRRPWWVYVTTGIVTQGRVLRWSSTWGEALGNWGDQLYDEKGTFFAGFSLPPPPQAQGAEAVEAARLWVNEHFKLDDATGEAAVLFKLQRASPQARGQIFARVLKSWGFQPEFVVANHGDESFAEDEFPWAWAYNQVLVRVPLSQGVLWYDPACSLCGLGQVRQSLKGVIGRGLRRKPGVSEGERYLASTLAVDALDGPAVKVAGVYRIQLTPEGPLGVSMRESWRGLEPPPDKLGEKWAQSRFAAYQMKRYHARVEGGEITREIELDVDNFATAVGAQWVVPLSLLSKRWENVHQKAERRGPILHSEDNHWREEVVLLLPDGWRIVQLPSAQSLDTPLYQVAFAVEPIESGVRIRRDFIVKKGTFSAELYPQAQAAINLYKSFRNAAITVEPNS